MGSNGAGKLGSLFFFRSQLPFEPIWPRMNATPSVIRFEAARHSLASPLHPGPISGSPTIYPERTSTSSAFYDKVKPMLGYIYQASNTESDQRQ